MESNDTLLTATPTDIDAGELGEFTFSGVIGDNPDTGDADDVDLYALELTESTRVAFDIDTNNSDPDSFFDSILRVFDSEGNEVAVNDDSNNADSFIGFQSPAAGTYYVGVSGFSNFDYNPSEIGSGTNANSTGNYDLTITTLESTTSGFTGGATLLKDINTTDNPYGNYPSGSNISNLTEFDGQLFFTADDGVTGDELWASDGTADGTQLLKDINTTDNPYGNYPSGSNISNLTEFDGQLFFTADDGVTGNELWVSDGTAGGTQLLKDIKIGASFDGSNISNLTEFDGQLFFTADDGVTGDELWVSDGTADGTQLLKDINTTDSPYGLPSSYASNLTEFDGQLFFTADDGVTGNELWVSDGTADGTQLLKDINTTDSPYGLPSSYASNFTEFDGQLFFTANDGVTGNELWVSDGTANGTQLLKDINLSQNSYSGPYDLTVAGDFLFFTADDGFAGQELWISDGTAAGTQLYQDINPGANGSNSGNLTVVGNQLLFTADDGTTGNELWAATIPDNLIAGDANNNVLNGTAGIDFINGLAGDDVIRGRRGNDLLNGGSDDDVLFGNGGDDTLDGNADNDRLFGDGGNDYLRGGAGDDLVEGGAGDDTVTVNDFSGIDSFDGGAGDDLLQFDPIDGRDLTIFLDSGNVGDGRRGGQTFTNFEEIVTGRGNDRLLGNDRANSLNGGDGNDELRGNGGRDQLMGGLGADILLGGRGADILEGGIGNDVLIGEGGADTFLFADDLLDGLADTDTIQDFQSRDILDFSAYVDAGGSIGANRVTSGFLRLDLSGEDTVNIFGSASALDTAESQI